MLVPMGWWLSEGVRHQARPVGRTAEKGGRIHQQGGGTGQPRGQVGPHGVIGGGGGGGDKQGWLTGRDPNYKGRDFHMADHRM